ncbi:glycosyltransferase family 4 protein [bacterium]|nr:glycosyltransferase family 4 protein [bacterium]
MKPKKALRIAQMHWAFPPTIGGVETHLTILMPELVRNGHQVSLLTGMEKEAPKREEYCGATIHRTPYMNLNYLLQHDPELLEEEIHETLKGFIEEFKPDLIHTHNMHYFTPVHAQVLSRLSREKGIPLLLTSHNAWDDILFLELSRDIPWDHIIAVSHFIKRELAGVGCDDRKITVIHHGIDVNAFHPGIDPTPVFQRFPQLKGKRIIFHPARMSLAKGNDVVVKAFRLVRERFRDAMLVLAGSSNIVDWEQTQHKDIAYILNLIKYFNLKKNVLIDVFSIQEMPCLYAACQVAVYPSTASEPFGLTLLEAIAMARPMIITEMGGMPEIIRDNVCGFVTQVRDHEALAARLIQLLHDERLRERMGKTGRSLVADHFSKELMTHNHEGVYRMVLEGRKAPMIASIQN